MLALRVSSPLQSPLRVAGLEIVPMGAECASATQSVLAPLWGGIWSRRWRCRSPRDPALCNLVQGLL